jgi:hypothetical protein
MTARKRKKKNAIFDDLANRVTAKRKAEFCLQTNLPISDLGEAGRGWRRCESYRR